MTTTTGFDPIFVHASMRSGSTYFFNVLRRNESLLCFNEAIMDGRKNNVRSKDRRSRDVAPARLTHTWDVNHHFLEPAYFDQVDEMWDSIGYLCPEFPEYDGYLPENGFLSHELIAYLSALMECARARGKRPALCEVSSRGRAGALRSTFGGFHIAQYRDPLSQFGSFIRGLIEGRTWTFLGTPVIELGTSGNHPLCRVIPEQWRVPELPWRTRNKAQFWASNIQYFAIVSAPDPETIEKVFRWHLFSWVLSNVAAISYSDLALDIDRVHDDANYRATVVQILGSRTGAAPDFSDIGRFDRYYEFESFDVADVCSQVVSTIRNSLIDGRLDAALGTLGSQGRVTPTPNGVELLLAKIRHSLAAMRESTHRRRVGAREWNAVAEKNRKIWFNPGIRKIAEQVYPLAAPVLQRVRLADAWYKQRYNRNSHPQPTL